MGSSFTIQLALKTDQDIDHERRAKGAERAQCNHFNHSAPSMQAFQYQPAQQKG
jgi:hypothetical protein